METQFKAVLAAAVQPLLKEHGFRKKGLNFYKSADDLVYLINIQKSHGNTSNELGFYINCAIQSLAIDEALDNTPKPFPKEYQCHFNERIEKLTDKASDKFIITPSTDPEALQAQLQESIADVLEYFAAIENTTTLVQYLSQTGTLHEDDIFRYCLRNGMKKEANQLAELFQRNIDEERWEEIFKERFLDILDEEDSDMQIDCLQ